MTIQILGDPTHGVESLSETLQATGLPVQINGTPKESTTAILAVSGQQGISNPTLDVLDDWNGTKIHLLAIVITEASPNIDPDQLELVFCEARHQIFPETGFDDIADAVPFLNDGLTDLSQQIQSLNSAPPHAFPVESIRADYLGYTEGLSPANDSKPWWKFW